MGVEDDTRVILTPMSVLPSLALGLALGVRHAADADHVAAVATIVTRGRSARGAAVLGAWWGIGHSASVLLAGGALVVLRLPMPVRLALALEFAVALMLIALGVRGVLAKRRDVPLSALRPFFVGIMHGLAGSALLALLVIGMTDNPWVAALYLVCFSIGTTAGMALVSALFALPARLGGTRVISLERAVRVGAGVASIVIGVSIAHRVAVDDGLFAAPIAARP
jgi:hypothetical protein